MKYDSDLQLALLRNQEIDGEVRHIEAQRSFRGKFVEEKSEMGGEIIPKGTDLSQNNSQVLRNEMDTDVPHSNSDIEDLEFIDKKIAELQQQLNYWLDKKRKNEEKQSKKEDMIPDAISYPKHSSVKSDHDNHYGSMKRAKCRNVNEYYNSIQESKENLMSDFNESGDRQSEFVCESEDDTESIHNRKLKVQKPQKNTISKVVKSKENIVFSSTKSGDRQSDVVSESEDDRGITPKKKLEHEQPHKNKSSKVVKSNENIMYAFTKSQSDVVSESEEDSAITRKLKDEQPQKNKSSKVVKKSNRNVLPSSSEEENIKDSRNAEKNNKNMDYNEEDYLYRKSWRTKISKRISEISSEDNSDSSDNDRREPLKRKVLSKTTKTNRSSKKIIRKLPSLLDEEKYSESSSDMELLTPESDNHSIGSVDDERLPSDDEHQPYLDHHGHMVLPPLMQ